MNLAAFFNTALGKALKVAIYQAAAVALAAYVSGGVNEQQAVFAGLVAGANSLLVFLQGTIDPATPTLPGSSVSVGAPEAPKK